MVSNQVPVTAGSKSLKRKKKSIKSKSPSKFTHTQASTSQAAFSSGQHISHPILPSQAPENEFGNPEIVNIPTSDKSHYGLFQQKNQINIVARKRPPAMPLKDHERYGIDKKRKVLYRNFHDIDGKIFLIEISRNALKVFILLFPNFEMPDIFMCEVMTEKKAQKLMTESNNMFEELVKKFHIKYEKLQIEGYHGHAKDPRRYQTVSPAQYRQGQMGQSYLADKFGYGNEGVPAEYIEVNEYEEKNRMKTDNINTHNMFTPAPEEVAISTANVENTEDGLQMQDIVSNQNMSSSQNAGTSKDGFKVVEDNSISKVEESSTEDLKNIDAQKAYGSFNSVQNNPILINTKDVNDTDGDYEIEKAAKNNLFDHPLSHDIS